MQSSSFRRLALAGVTVLLAAGCAQLPAKRDKPSSAAETTDVVEYTVLPGDTLAGIARSITRNQNNWEVLARFNNIKDPRTLAVGFNLKIPASLLAPDRNRKADATNDAVLNAPAALTVATAASSPEKPPPVNQPAWVFQPTAIPGPTRVAVVLRKAAVNRHFDIIRFGQDQLNLAISPAARVKQVRIMGSYYPIGVYVQPFNYAPLLMRVTPGTVFELNDTVGDWYRISTERGIGYIRKREAEIIGAADYRNVSASS